MRWKVFFFEPPLGYDIVECFVCEVKKLENSMVFFFENTKKDIFMTKEDEELYKKNNI